ncbi:MAG: AAA family ATPase [Weeksellaceae bacterium]|nr:AAA family ATPase [Weeksellaceae bacterium]
MEKFFTSFFSLLGLEVYRKTKKNEIIFPNNQKPVYIELIGVSGVGKSTVYRELLKNHQFFLTINDFKKRNSEINSVDLIGTIPVYQKLAENQWKYIQNLDILETDKFRIAHWNYKTLQEDALLSSFNTNSLIVSDEGILHNFQFSLLELYKENQDLFYDFLKNRKVIYCFSSKEQIVEQIQKREKETGRIVAHHKGKSKDELLKLVEKELKEKDEFIKIIKRFNISILEINTQNSFEKNNRKISEFIKHN